MKQKQMKKSRLSRLTTKLLLVALLVVSVNIAPHQAQAASLTSMSDVMSRLKASTASNHEIKFVTPSGVQSGETITLTFSGGFTGIGSLVGADFDFAENSGSNCSAGSWTEESVVTSTPSSSQFSIAGSGQVVTITSGGASATIALGVCVRLRIGTNATDTTGSGPGSNQITNGAIGSSDTITIAGSFGDTGTIAVEIITNDQITISATVDPTITFTLIDFAGSDNAIGFGTLTNANARYATSTTGSNSNTDPAVTMTVATNASGGYVLSYLGDTLKSGGDSISPATIAGDADGTPDSSQFATSYSTNGTSTVVSSYSQASTNWNFAANTTTTIVSRTTPTNTETISGRYIANINGTQPAGSYSTILTYIATSTF